MTIKEAHEKKRLTLEDLKSIDREMISSTIVAKFIGCDPYGLSLRARRDPDKVPFPFIMTGETGTHVMFSRHGVIAWAEGKSKNTRGKAL